MQEVGEGKPYVPRGVVIDRLAREKKNLRKQEEIARFMAIKAAEFGYDPDIAKTRSTIGNYLYGRTVPDEDWLTLFSIAFELTEGEMAELAFSHSFRPLAAA